MTLSPLPRLIIEPLVRAALVEDLGRAGDITTDAIVPAGDQARMAIVARQAGTIAGLDLAALAFELVDPRLAFDAVVSDGMQVKAGDALALVSGPARGLLTGERVALNFLGRMSGIATATCAVVAAIAPHPTRVVCTRKTTPLLRSIEKYAVRAGGVDLGEAMVRAGWAVEYRTFSHGAYAAAEAQAKAAKRGLWAGTFEPPSAYRADERAEVRAAAPPVPTGSCVIKGNINAQGRRIFHQPGQRDYAATVINTSHGERWFCTPAEAQAAGWTPAQR